MNGDGIFWMLALMLVLLLFSAFFAMSETAFVSLGKLRPRYLIKQKKRNAHIAYRIVKNLDRLIATILVGNNFVNIAFSALGTAVFIYFFGNSVLSLTGATLTLTLLVLIFGEITPKIFAVKHSEKVALASAWTMEAVMRLLHPLVKVFLGISNVLLRFLRQQPTSRSPLVTEEEIRLMIELGREEGVLTDAERRMLHRIFEFGDTRVFQVMVPLRQVSAIDSRASFDSLIQLVLEQGHSRIPVYEGKLDNILGVIHARELLRIRADCAKEIELTSLLHRPHFINYRKKVSEVLREFQRIRVYMAIVVDDNGKTLGLVTLEDLVEEIVGEIEGDIS